VDVTVKLHSVETDRYSSTSRVESVVNGR